MKSKESFLRRAYSQARGMAIARGKAFTLTIEEYARLDAQPCHYCGGHVWHKPRVGGLDRIDNALGYTITNVLPCCYVCNITRGNRFTVDEFEVMVKALIKYRYRKTVRVAA